MSQCWVLHFLIVMLNIIMLSVIMLSVIMLSVIMLSVVIQNVVMLSVMALIRLIEWVTNLFLCCHVTDCLGTSFSIFESSIKIKYPSGANVIKLFTAVIYCHSTVIPSFCVIKWYYYGSYCGMLVSDTMVIYHGISTLEKIGTAVN